MIRPQKTSIGMKPFCFITGIWWATPSLPTGKKNCLSRTKCPRYKLCVALTSFHAYLHLCPFCRYVKHFKKSSLSDCIFSQLRLKSFQQDGFFKSLVFMSQFPKFTFDCIVLSLCSAFGQLFIFHTIDAFGKSERFLKESLKACNFFQGSATIIAILYVLSGTTAFFSEIACYESVH